MSEQREQQTVFREKSYITVELPETENYKLVRALTMNLAEETNKPIVDIEKFLGEIFTGFKVYSKEGYVREWAGMAAAIVVENTRTIMASQMYDASFNPKAYEGVTTYSDYYSTRDRIGGSRLTWLGAPAIVYTYKNRNRLKPFLGGSLVINSMFWITSFASAKCFDDYGKYIDEQHPGYLRTKLLEKIEEYKKQATIDSDSASSITKYIFAFDIDDTLCKQDKEKEKKEEKEEKEEKEQQEKQQEEEEEKTKKKAKKKTNLSIAQTDDEFIRNIIDRMKRIIQTRNYVWIITANKYPKHQFLDIYFTNHPQDKEFFKNSEYFFYMNNTNISLIYEDAKKFFFDNKLLDPDLTIDKVHDQGLKPYALYAQSLIEKYNYNTRHPTSTIGNFEIYLFDDNNNSNLKTNCEEFGIKFKQVTDFATPPVPNLLDHLDEILREKELSSQEQTQAQEQTQSDKIQTQAVSLYCDNYEELKKFCKKDTFQQYNTYKNYYANEDQTKDEGEFLTSLYEAIIRIQEEDESLKRFNTEKEKDYYQRYNEIYSYVYPWDIEGIEVGAIDREQTQDIIDRINKERNAVKIELAKIIGNLKDSFKRINMIIYTIINNPDYANRIYDYITNKPGLKITYTLFLLTKLILLSKCNIKDIFTNKKFEFSLETDEDLIKNLVTEIIRIMEEPLKYYEYTFNEETKCFEMKTIQTFERWIFERRISKFILFRQDDEDIKKAYRNILCTKQSEIQLETIEESPTGTKAGIKRTYRRNKSRRNKSRRKHKKKLISF